jgi:phosphoglycerate dehydrogenase-like enzyme
MKVLLHYSPAAAWERDLAAFRSQGLEIECCEPSDDERFYRLLPEVEVLWHVLRPVRAEDIAQAPKLRLIQKIGTGINTIDLEAAKARGISVCNMPGTNSRAVAEMTLLLMLACLRRLPALDRATREGRGWCLAPGAYGELSGKTVCLIGYGSVGRMLAPILESMGARVIHTGRRWRRELPDLLREADIVSLHVPLTSGTAKMIGRERLKMMRPGAILINTARGRLVDQAALLEALVSGHLGAAGLDVFVSEPAAEDDPLFRLDNVVLTPHVAWLTEGTWTRSLEVGVENCRRLAAGEPLLHRVV